MLHISKQCFEQRFQLAFQPVRLQLLCRIFLSQFLQALLHRSNVLLDICYAGVYFLFQGSYRAPRNVEFFTHEDYGSTPSSKQGL
jgi:hypothetical protein